MANPDREAQALRNLTFRAKDLEALAPLLGRVVPSELKTYGPVELSHWVDVGWYKYAGADGQLYLIEVPRQGSARMFRPTIRGAS